MVPGYSDAAGTVPRTGAGGCSGTGLAEAAGAHRLRILAGLAFWRDAHARPARRYAGRGSLPPAHASVRVGGLHFGRANGRAAGRVVWQL